MGLFFCQTTAAESWCATCYLSVLGHFVSVSLVYASDVVVCYSWDMGFGLSLQLVRFLRSQGSLLYCQFE